MTSPVELFTLALLCTAGLYVVMLAYFNGLVDTKRPNTRILWNSEPVFWFLALLVIFSALYWLTESPAETAGPGLWYVIGAGNLAVIYTYLVLKLARHDLPEKICWVIAALVAISILYVIANIVQALFAATLDLARYAAELTLLFSLLTHILLVILLFLLARSLWSSVMHIWSAEASASGRLTAGGVTVSAIGSVNNARGAISDINHKPGTKPEVEWAIVYPGSGIIVDFGIRRLEDHGFRSDLRIIRGNAEQPITVEVSNDKQNWQLCFQDEKLQSDWDVPYYSNPWRYVRILNKGEQPTQIAEVYDLD